MSAQHTPGPWRINAACPFARDGQISIETDNYYIALIDDGARQKANASLIAAAPELLEALKKISAIENQEWGADWEEIEEARNIADTAIAKAEGENND